MCCITMAFIPKDHTTWILVLFLIGKCVIGATYQLVWLITCEIYPTNLRVQALGTCSTVARLFGQVCPYVSTLAVYWKPLPMLVLGLPALLAAMLSLLVLPETSKESLPQDMDEALNLTKKNAKDVAHL